MMLVVWWLCSGGMVVWWLCSGGMVVWWLECSGMVGRECGGAIVW